MITKTLEKLDGEFVEEIKKYNDLMKKLDVYRGKELNDKEAKEVNKLLEQIQKKFTHEIVPVIEFIQKRTGQGETLCEYYNKFINDLVKAGAITTSEYNKDRGVEA